jgi:hypothetical protein
VFHQVPENRLCLRLVPPVHRTCQLNDLDQTIFGEVLPFFHPSHYSREFLEVDVLLRLQGMAFEELHHLEQAFQLPDPQFISILMIIPYDSAPEKTLQGMEHLGVLSVLDDPVFRKDLISNRHIRMFIDTDEEATFSIGKSNNPVRGNVHG